MRLSSLTHDMKKLRARKMFHITYCEVRSLAPVYER